MCCLCSAIRLPCKVQNQLWKKCWNCSICFQIIIHLHITNTHTDSDFHCLTDKAYKWSSSSLTLWPDLWQCKQMIIHLFFFFQHACCGFSFVALVSLLSLCWLYICLITFNDREDVNWWVSTNLHTHACTHTYTALNLTQKPRILSFLSLSFLSLLMTSTLLTLCCPLLFHYQAGLHKTEAMGELVHGGDHHLCSVNQLLHPAAGENAPLMLWHWIVVGRC